MRSFGFGGLHINVYERVILGERPYKCHLPDCGRAFIQLSNLQQHLRNHDAQVERAKNRPFHCNICGKGFATESSLRTHTSKVGSSLRISQRKKSPNHRRNVNVLCYLNFANCSTILIETRLFILKFGFQVNKLFTKILNCWNTWQNLGSISSFKRFYLAFYIKFGSSGLHAIAIVEGPTHFLLIYSKD